MAQQFTVKMMQDVLRILDMNEYELAKAMGKTPEEARKMQSELHAVIRKHTTPNTELDFDEETA